MHNHDFINIGEDFLRSTTIFILAAGIQKVRCELFKRQIIKYGGSVTDTITPSTTHVLVDEKMDYQRLNRIVKTSIPDSVSIVKSMWLTKSLKDKGREDENGYKLKIDEDESTAPTKKVVMKTDLYSFHVSEH